MADQESASTSRNTVSRRQFIKGVIAAGTSVSAASYLFRGSDTILGQQASPPGAVERLITLNVNGQQRHVDVTKQETLAMTLRNKLGLTGTKVGCERAECGSCTVLIDDVPHYACSLLTHAVRGRQITTIEGLAAPRRHAASGAAGNRGRGGLPVRILRARLHPGDGRFSEDESSPVARRAGSRHLGKPVPMPGLRQDRHGPDAGRGVFSRGAFKEVLTWPTN